MAKSAVLSVRIISDAKNAVRELNKVEGAVDDTAKEAERSSSRFDKFKRGVHAGAKVAAVAFVAAGAAALKLAQGAAEDEKSAALLAQQLRNTTGATDNQVAAVERWISKQGELYGITDDELRPALSRLATATGDVDKAQQLASLSMDVAAGTGKSFESVSTAMAKAAAGNVGALGRLGIATKDAEGNTKTFSQLQTDLAAKFKGDARVAADTLSGRMQIMRTRLSEAGESIGYTLIPILTSLAGILTRDVLPVIERVTNWAQQNPTQFKIVAAAIAAVGAAFIVASAAIKIYEASGKIATIATKVWTAAQWLFNAAMNANPIALVVIAVVALVAAIIYAYKHSARFREIVQRAFAMAKDAAQSVADFFTKTIPAAFDKIRDAASSVVAWVRAHWKAILFGLLTGPIGLALVFIVKHWDKIKKATTKVIGQIISFIKGIPGKIRTGLSKLVSTVRDLFSKAWQTAKDRVTTIGGNLLSWIRDVPGKIRDGLSRVRSIVSDLFRNAMQAGKDKVTSIGGTIVSWIRGIPGKISALASNFKTAGGKLLQGLLDGMKSAAGIISGIAGNVWTAIKATLNGAIRKINAAIPDKIGPIRLPANPFPTFARGTLRYPGGFGIVGEYGRELVRLPTGSRIYTNAQTEQMLTQQGTGDVIVYIELDGQRLGPFVDRRVDRAVTGQARRIRLRAAV